MKTKIVALIIISLLGIAGSVLGGEPIDTVCKLKCTIKENGQPANGTFDVITRIFDAEVGGTEAAPPTTGNGVAVANRGGGVAREDGAVPDAVHARGLPLIGLI